MSAFLRKIIIDNEDYLELFFDENELISFYSSKKYKLSNLSKYIDVFQSKKRSSILIKSSLATQIYKKIINNIEDICQNLNIKINYESNLKKNIEQKILEIESRKNIGIDLKNSSFNDKLTESLNIFSKKISKYLIRPLKKQQLINSFFNYVMNKSCNFSVPGAGKTCTTLAVFAALYDACPNTKILVICPKNSFDSWINEWKETFGNNIKLDYQILNNNKNNIAFFRTKNLILINYENVNSFSTIANYVLDANTLVVFDEVHKIKNPDGIRSTKWLQMIQSNNNAGIILMTGTPLPNSYLDLYVYANLIFGAEIKNFFPYEREILDAASKNNDELTMKSVNRDLYPFFIRTSKKDLNIKSPLPDIIHTCDASSHELKIFEEINDSVINPLQKIILLLELESNPYLLSEKNIDYDVQNFWDESELFNQTFQDISLDIGDLTISSKFKKTVDIIKKLISEDKKIILWCIFTRTIQLFEMFLNKNGIKSIKIYGSTNEQERSKIINDYKNGHYDVLITNPHTLGESVSFHKIAHDAIYYDLSYNLVHFLQSKNRIHRIGLNDNDYTQYHFITQSYRFPYFEFNLMKKIYERLSYKENIMNEAIENKMLEGHTFSTDDDIKFILRDLNQNLVKNNGK
ncbi:DEAD/DEAH box helicase [Mycoplasma zalophidermidis]|uniref:DEAD/DEAH box helicase n=1 Tax=Mycoplasma zalophidermidis TaxID=398174 RepID=UPI00215CED00|nr:DEAD/DEAH box helicase [Mycoplasma zalophidermidis]MCR8966443.1 DEAD/DEAH box helicase [Mycoplasma zalophidermidis]